MKRGIIVGAGLVGTFLIIGATKSYLGRPSDSQLIQSALNQAIADARDGKPGKVMSLLSSGAQYNDESSIPRSEVANYIKNGKPDVTVLNPTPVIGGDTATILSPVDVRLKIAMITTPAVRVNARIEFKREMAFSWLIFPVSTWKITKITADGSPPEL